MDALPVETLTLLLSFLPRKDRLVCLRVCKLWQEVVSSIAYEDLEFESSLDRFLQAD